VAPTRAAPARTALVKRTFRDARVRTITFAYVFAIYSWLQPEGYRKTYPTLGDRIAFAHSFAGNDAIRLFYGYPYDVMTVGGYSAWRVGGTLALAAAVFGVLAAVRAQRAEEEAGRTELVLAGAVSRRTAFRSSMTAIGAGTALLWLAAFLGFVLAHLPVAGSAYLALAAVAVIPPFVGLGAVMCQLAPTRRGALSLSIGVVMVCWLLRVVADTWSSGAWLRWATPLGWAEELRAFTGTHAMVLLLFVATTVPLLWAAEHIGATRDVGSGLLAESDTASPRLYLLGSPGAQALRTERGTLAAWLLGISVFAAIFGMIATSVSSAGISENLQREVAKLGTGSIFTPTGYLSFVFIVFILAVCLFVCGQVAAARIAESDQQLETLLAHPVGRTRWLVGRYVIAVFGAAVLSLLAGFLAWAGATSQGVHISLVRMLEAGANCLPVAILFLGIAGLAYAVVPRASAAISYLLVTASFLWFIVGALLGLPRWLVDATPFVHVGLVPEQAFRTTDAVVMAAVGLLAACVSLAVFRRRDLLGS
jgi:ABC-2 type transport system permease protein